MRAFLLPFLAATSAIVIVVGAPGCGGSDSGDSGSGDSGSGDSGSGDSGDTGSAVHMVSMGGGGGATTSFTGEYVEADCPTTCDGNTDPSTSGPDILINGVWEPVPTPHAGDLVAVASSFYDAECNLACGASYYSWTSPEESEASAGSLPSNLPCDSTSSGVYLGFDFGVVEAGDYTWDFHVEDACGGQSRRVTGSLTVVP